MKNQTNRKNIEDGSTMLGRTYPVSQGLIVEGYFSERQHQQVDKFKEIVRESESYNMTVSDLMASLEDVEYD